MKKTKQALFLEEMERILPWSQLYALTESYYQAPANGRRAARLRRMLRLYLVQQWFSLSDDQVEDALYDSPLIRYFVGLDPLCDPIPDSSLVGSFRKFLEKRALGEEIRTTVNQHLQNKGMTITTGRLVDAKVLHGIVPRQVDRH